MKTCFKCGQNKALEDFYKHKGTVDGLLGKCKTCTKEDVARRYVDKRQYVRDYDKKRSAEPERKRKVADYQRKHVALNPEKSKARRKVNNSIRDGHLARQLCQRCGDTAEAHHEDYSKPLDVRWLCFKCHREEHGQKVG